MTFRKHIPNILTISRILLTPIFLLLLFSDLQHGKLFALCVFIVASLTDLYDGMMARKYDVITRFGNFLDPIADKLLVLSAFFSFLIMPELDVAVKMWMIILIIFRDVFVTILRVIMELKNITMVTSRTAKLKTTLQMIVIHLILIYLTLISYNISFIQFLQEFKLIYLLMFITSIVTGYTGFHYLVTNYRTLRSLLREDSP